MKCRRAFDADLSAVVRGEAADADFAAHVATCPDCAAELRVWTELDALLRAGAPPAAEHPEPETLVAFVDAPATLAAGAHAAIERHLAVCRVCADEVGGLRRFDPVRTVAALTTPNDDAVEPAVSRGAIARVLWHPAFAYALVAVLLVPLVRQQIAHVPEASRIAAMSKEAEAPVAQPAAPAAGLDGAVRSAPPPAMRSGPPVVPPPAPPSGRAERVAKKAAPAEGPPALADSPVEQAMERRRQAPPRAPAAAAPEVRAELERDEGAPSLSELAGRAGGAAADTASARPPDPQGAPVVLEVGSNEATFASSAVAGRPVRLRVVPPADFAPGPIDVRVRGRSATREIVTRVADRADAIVVEIPAGWLVPGEYAVTLAPVAAAPGSAPVNLAFRVAGPGAPR